MKKFLIINLLILITIMSIFSTALEVNATGNLFDNTISTDNSISSTTNLVSTNLSTNTSANIQISNSIETSTNTLEIPNNMVNSTLEQQENINSITNSISKLPQTGDFFNVKDGLLMLIVISIIFLVTIIIKDIIYKNTSKK